MEFNPKVSIVIPVYNGSNYLREAIDSALAQTYKNIEVIVINDGSDDGGKTEEIARAYGDKIRYFNKENGGVASALNLGIREMKGEYFSWLSHDDVYYPNKIEIQINYLKKGKRDIILYSDYDFIDHKSRFIRTERIEDVEPQKFRYALITSHPIHGCTALIPRSCFDNIGLFNENLKSTQDYIMWFNMAKKYDFIHIHEVLIQSRLHPEQGFRTIVTHLEECNDFFVWCLNELSIKEILDSTEDNSIASCYLRLAINLKKRGYRASLHAFELARQNLHSDSFFHTLKNILLIGYYKVLN